MLVKCVTKLRSALAEDEQSIIKTMHGLPLPPSVAGELGSRVAAVFAPYVGDAVFARPHWHFVGVLRALALHIDLPEHFFDDKTNFGNSILRPIHYPPITSPDIPNVRAGAHEDINFITLLVGASAAGLEVKSRKANGWRSPRKPTPSSSI